MDCFRVSGPSAEQILDCTVLITKNYQRLKRLKFILFLQPDAFLDMNFQEHQTIANRFFMERCTAGIKIDHFPDGKKYLHVICMNIITV